MNKQHLAYLVAGLICMGLGLYAPWLEDGSPAFALGLGLSAQPLHALLQMAVTMLVKE